MSEGEEECDELPPITVNSSGRDSSRFAMPCAVELAAQRAREVRCERELARLRECERERPGAVAHSDSSGSEGEAALAAAVTALRVRAAARASPPPRLAALLPAAAPSLPAPAAAFLREYARAAADLTPRRADRLARTTLGRIESWLASDGSAAGSEEAAAFGAWLCLVPAAAERVALGAAATRAAHRLLGEAPRATAALARALPAAVLAPRARLDLADALRGAGDASDALVRAALADLLALSSSSEEEWDGGAAARWRRLDAAAQYTALQLAARARARCGRGADADAGRLLDALVAAPPAARDHTPDALKVLVAASKMQVLFPVKK